MRGLKLWELLANMPCAFMSRVGTNKGLTALLLLSGRTGIGRFINFMGKDQDGLETVSKCFCLSCNGRQPDFRTDCYKLPSQDNLDNGTEVAERYPPQLLVSMSQAEEKTWGLPQAPAVSFSFYHNWNGTLNAAFIASTKIFTDVLLLFGSCIM